MKQMTPEERIMRRRRARIRRRRRAKWEPLFVAVPLAGLAAASAYILIPGHGITPTGSLNGYTVTPGPGSSQQDSYSYPAESPAAAVVGATDGQPQAAPAGTATLAPVPTAPDGQPLSTPPATQPAGQAPVTPAADATGATVPAGTTPTAAPTGSVPAADSAPATPAGDLPAATAGGITATPTPDAPDVPPPGSVPTPTDTGLPQPTADPTDTGVPTDTPTPTPTVTSTPTPTPTPTDTPSGTAVPFAPALSSYATVTQSYSASDIINGGWAQAANDTEEGGGTCPVANTIYSPALDAVELTTTGQPVRADSSDCAHIRSKNTVPTSGDVVEAKIWLPGLATAASFGGSSYPAGTLLDWASMWTDGADSVNGRENWPADTEIDAVETQYGANYVSVHYGQVASGGGSTGIWSTEPRGWDGDSATYATPVGGVPNVQPGWNVVDIEFTSTVANVYFNGALYVTIPASVLTHKPAYLNFGISGPNANDPNSASWPSGPATEDVQYVKVFS